jgi:hypothetical protein
MPRPVRIRLAWLLSLVVILAGLRSGPLQGMPDAFADGAFVVAQNGSGWVVSGGVRYQLALITDSDNVLPTLPEGPTVHTLQDVLDAFTALPAPTATDAPAPFPDGSFVVGQDGLPWVVGHGRRLALLPEQDRDNLIPRLPQGRTVATVDELLTVLNAAPAIRFSDSFQRPDADGCALGPADLTLGGSERYTYLPIFAAGARIVAGALQNPGQDLGGIQVTASPGACTSSAIRGADLGQDLTIRVDLLVPTDAVGRITQAGPYLRSRAAAAGDGIFGGTSAGYWAALDSTGVVSIVRLNPVVTVATSAPLPGFDAGAFHTLVVDARGLTLQVVLDGQRLSFDQDASAGALVAIPPVWEGPPAVGVNQGTAGIAFAPGPTRGQIGGQRAANLVVLR